MAINTALGLAAMGAGASAGQSVMSQGGTAIQNFYDRKLQREQLNKNLEFQHYMTANRAQMSVKDMKAAGINPATGAAAQAAAGGGGQPQGKSDGRNTAKRGGIDKIFIDYKGK